MTSRLTTRGVVVTVIAGVASAGLAGVAAAKPHPGKLAPTHLTVHATKTKLTKGDNVKASVTGTLRSHKTPVANETVTVYERKNGIKKWTATSSTAVTDASGQASFAFVQTTAKEQYELVFAGDSTYKKSHSGTITINRAKVGHSG